MFNKLKNSFPFRSGPNFLLCFLGFSGVGYFGTSYLHKQKYDHPIVQEALRILQHNDQIIQLAGYPLSLQINMGSNATQNNDVCQFSFQVVGPKGAAKVELMGQSRELQEIQNKTQYYIPSSKQMTDVMKYNKDVDALQNWKLTPDVRLWKIDHLVADIGLQGDFRIVLVDSNQVLKKDVAQAMTPPLVTDRRTLYDLKLEIDARKPKVPTTEQEIEEARRYRQQELYRKVGGVRNITIISTIIGAMAIYNYVKANRRISVLNTQIHRQSLIIIQTNPQIKKLFGQNIQFNQQLRGGQIRDQAEFETDMYGQKAGVCYVKGQKNKKTNDWEIETIDVAVKDAQEYLVDLCISNYMKINNQYHYQNQNL
ncbi:unnamed protein product [Paramecium octaurelia]|uniref:Transmembrane protein n=1 Tax=Paramecium octaurelia TaxID=43137 RepID=A0A8S1WVK8_PAROT|nr:unnamed protein product [Paramecium octaurelia]